VRISRWTALWILIVAVLVVVEASIVTGVLSLNNLVGFFILFVFGLVVITVMAIVGAVFVGMFVSHRILSTQGFTPFEQEMLRMRQDVKELAKRVEELGARLGFPADAKRP